MSQTYEEFVAEVDKAAHEAPSSLRYGQVYFNMLPAEIADMLCTTHMDPYYHDFVTQECHDRVRNIWDRR